MLPWWAWIPPVLVALAAVYYALHRPTLSSELRPPPFPPEEAATRKLPVIAKTCSNCAHFDLEEGQAIIANHPAFVRAANAVPPSQMGRKVVRTFERDCRFCSGSGKVEGPAVGGLAGMRDCSGCEGTGKIQDQELSPPGAPAKARWDQFGACQLKQELCWGGDIRPCHEVKREDAA